jgi:hypothetical protein
MSQNPNLPVHNQSTKSTSRIEQRIQAARMHDGTITSIDVMDSEVAGLSLTENMALNSLINSEVTEIEFLYQTCMILFFRATSALKSRVNPLKFAMDLKISVLLLWNFFQLILEENHR